MEKNKADWETSVVDLDAITRLDEVSNCGVESAARLVQIAMLVGELDAVVAGLEAKAERLRRMERCNGVVYWRDKRAMQINHPTGRDCPACGDRNGRSRIRQYVGTDAHKQNGATAAIANWQAWIEVKKELAAAVAEYRRVVGLIHVIGRAEQKRMRI